jgi:DNA-binding IclR family transcriptional regulator
VGNITEKAQRILDAIQAEESEWITRSEIAAALGQPRLVPYDVRMLDRLVSANLLEEWKRPRDGVISFEWVYRAKH